MPAFRCSSYVALLLLPLSSWNCSPEADGLRGPVGLPPDERRGSLPRAELRWMRTLACARGRSPVFSRVRHGASMYFSRGDPALPPSPTVRSRAALEAAHLTTRSCGV